MSSEGPRLPIDPRPTKAGGFLLPSPMQSWILSDLSVTESRATVTLSEFSIVNQMVIFVLSENE